MKRVGNLICVYVGAGTPRVDINGRTNCVTVLDSMGAAPHLISYPSPSNSCARFVCDDRYTSSQLLYPLQTVYVRDHSHALFLLEVLCWNLPTYLHVERHELAQRHVIAHVHLDILTQITRVGYYS